MILKLFFVLAIILVDCQIDPVQKAKKMTSLIKKVTQQESDTERQLQLDLKLQR